MDRPITISPPADAAEIRRLENMCVFICTCRASRAHRKTLKEAPRAADANRPQMRHVVVALSVGILLLACGSQKRDGFQNTDPTLAGDDGGGGSLGGAGACKAGGKTCVGND